MTVRDVAKGKQVADELLADGKQAGKVEIIKMDLGSLESIQAGAQVCRVYLFGSRQC